jgi:hypothetical protein
MNEGYEYPDESRERSYLNQTYFASVNFYPLAFIGMGHYIARELVEIYQEVIRLHRERSGKK